MLRIAHLRGTVFGRVLFDWLEGVYVPCCLLCRILGKVQLGFAFVERSRTSIKLWIFSLQLCSFDIHIELLHGCACTLCTFECLIRRVALISLLEMTCLRFMTLIGCGIMVKCFTHLFMNLFLRLTRELLYFYLRLFLALLLVVRSISLVRQVKVMQQIMVRRDWTRHGLRLFYRRLLGFLRHDRTWQSFWVHERPLLCLFSHMWGHYVMLCGCTH